MSHDEKRGIFTGFYLAMFCDAWWDHRVPFAALCAVAWLVCYVSMGGFRLLHTEES